MQNKDDVEDQVEVDALNKEVINGMVGQIGSAQRRTCLVKSDSEQAEPPSQVTRDHRSPEPQPNSD